MFIPLLKRKYPKELDIKIGNAVIKVEVATSIIQKARGLMFRKELGNNRGMIFVFNNEAKYSFWMLNTYIPLDIIWLDKGKEIVSIVENTIPWSKNNIWRSLFTTYSPNNPSLYAIEVDAGWVKKNEISENMRALF